MAKDGTPALLPSDTPDVATLLGDLRRHGIRVRVEGGDLKVTAPKGRLNKDLVAALKLRKAELIDLLSADDVEDRLPPLRRAPNRNDRYHQLSFAQRRLWVLDRMTGGKNPFYNVPAALDLIGVLDRDALLSALKGLAERHNQLRARFSADGDTPMVEIADDGPDPVDHDLSHLSTAEAQATARELCRAETKRPFDLEKEGPFRILLIRLDEQHHTLLINTHHIISDGWSLALIIRDLAAAYAQAVAPPSDGAELLPALSVDYCDFTEWQRGWLTGKRLESQIAYWTAALKDAPHVLDLPADHPRPKEASFRGASVPAPISADLSAKVRDFAKRHGTTPFMILMAVYQLLLGRLTGRSDLLVGTPIANRRDRALEDIVGFFANTLVFRADWKPTDCFLDLIGQTRKRALEAYNNQDLPFEVLVDHIRPDRSLDRMPLVQAVFALQNAPQRDFDLPGLEARPRSLDFDAVRFDVELHLWDKPGEPLSGTWIYATDLFEEETVSRWHRCFQTLLDSALTEPEMPVQRIPLLDAESRKAAIRRPVLEPSGSLVPACLHEGFQAQAKRRPHSEAVCCGDHRLTYLALDGASDALAIRLRDSGVRPGDPVILCLQRGTAWLIGILGVLKCGAHYVPVDPTYPSARKTFILNDCDPAAIIVDEPTDGEHAAAEPAFGTSGGRPMLALGAEAPDLNPQGLEPKPSVTAQDIAYIIYTSGTTGRPKGVPVSHGNVLSLFRGSDRHFDFSPDTVSSVAHSFAFDFSVWEVWSALLFGGRAVVAQDWEIRSPDDLLDLLDREAVTALSQTPTAFRHLMAAEARRSRRRLEQLRWIVFGGETLSPGSLKPWVERYGIDRPTLINMYGITETTVHVTFHKITTGDLDRHGSPIGRPLAHLGVVIADPQGMPVPDGVVGEILVWGEGVSTGYLKRPEPTQERFVAPPDGSAGKCYRSGDLGRWRNDGILEHLGRSDDQISLRGFRIEPAEIEAALDADPSIAAAVVLVAEVAENEQQLVAYAVPSDGAAPDLSDGSAASVWATKVRTDLLDQLPSHMVPARIIPLKRLPLTANGKLDREGLPSIRSVEPSTETEAPEDPREAIIAAVFAEVLNRPHVGRHENFFEMGGDSILAILAVSRLNRAGIKAGTKTIFRYQSAASLAEAADRDGVPLASQEPVSGAVTPTAIQHWFLQQDLGTPHHFNQAMRFRAKHPVDPSVLQDALDQLVRHHDALRLHLSGRDLVVDGPDRVRPVPLTLVSDDPSEASAIAQAQSSFDPARPPLLHAILKKGRDADEIVLVAHHLVIDTVSWWILSEDLAGLLSAHAAGRQPVLPPKSTSIADWTERLRRQADGPELAEDFDYWSSLSRRSKELAEADLPLDGPNPAAPVATRDVRQVETRIPKDQIRILLEDIAPRWDVSAGNLLAAMVAYALCDALKIRTVALDLEGHGRADVFDDIDLTRTIGWFTALYPAHLELGPEIEAEGKSSPVSRIEALARRIARIPKGGFGYGVFSQFEKIPPVPTPRARFNYLGRLDAQAGGSRSAYLQSLPDTVPGCHGPDVRLTHSLDILGATVDGNLLLLWSYAEEHLKPETVAAAARTFQEVAATLADADLVSPFGDMDDAQSDALRSVLAGADSNAEDDPFADILGAL